MSEVKKVSVQLGDDCLVFETGKIVMQALQSLPQYVAGMPRHSRLIMFQYQSSTTRSTMPPVRFLEDS